MADLCEHLEGVRLDTPAGGPGCYECTLTGDRWVHLRRCLTCGHVGCCDSSPNKHATAHFREEAHPVVQSYEPSEDWLWCYVDDLLVEPADGVPSPSHS